MELRVGNQPQLIGAAGVAGDQLRVGQVVPPHVQPAAVRHRDGRHVRPVLRSAVEPVRSADRQRHEERRGAGQCHETGRRESAHPDHRGGVAQKPRPAAGELAGVPPRGELPPLRPADAHQLQALPRPRQSDVPGRHAERRSPEQPLALLDRLPPPLHGTQAPAGAPGADGPEPPPSRVERQPPAYREALDDRVLTERRVGP